jgi:uncharacterized protein
LSTFFAGLLLGLAGSVHCACMCGPLVLSVGRLIDPRGSRLPPLLVYHGGRIAIYLLLAAAAGLAGHGLSFGVSGRTVSVVSGVMLLAIAAGWGQQLVPRQAWLFWSAALRRASVAAQRYAQTHPLAGRALAGMINGLLPCGLVYAAAIAAAGTARVSTAMVLMAGFGLGTIPVLLAISLSAASLPRSLRARMHTLAPAALLLTGVLLIVRGLAPAHESGHRTIVERVIHHHD